MAVLAHEEAAHIRARQARFELAQFVGVEFIDLDAIVAPQCPGEAVFRQRFGRAVDIKMPALMHESVGAGHLRQFAHERHGRPDQGPHRRPLSPSQNARGGMVALHQRARLSGRLRGIVPAAVSFVAGSSMEEPSMRVSALLVAGALALGVSAVSANAAPAVPDLGVTAGSANIVEAAFGCGRGFHPNHWGRCVPNRWSYNRGWNDRYYGGGYQRPWRHRYNYGY